MERLNIAFSSGISTGKADSHSFMVCVSLDEIVKVLLCTDKTVTVEPKEKQGADQSRITALSTKSV